MPVQLLVIDVAIVVCTLLLLVRPGIDPSPPPAPLGAESHHGGWIAASALASAILLPRLSMAFTIAVCGIFMLQRLCLPLVTGGGGVRRWLSWVLWSVALLACPLAIAAVMACAHRTGTGLHAWAAHVVDVLWVAHLGVLVLAAVAVVVLTGGGRRWLAWAAILAHGIFAAPFIGFAMGSLMEREGVAMSPSLCLVAVPCHLVALGHRARFVKRVLIILAILTAAGLAELGATATSGEGSPELAEQWRAKLMFYRTPEEARSRDSGIQVRRFENGEWLFGLAQDSHGDWWRGGGTLVVKDSHGQVRAFLGGHICGSGYLEWAFSKASLNSFYDDVRTGFTEHRAE